MAQIVIMPKEGITVESCLVGAWRKEVGDPVATDDVLFEYETDKAAFECVSTASGVLLHRFFGQGDEAPVLAPVAIVGEAGEDISAMVAGAGGGGAPEAAMPEPKPAAALAPEAGAPGVNPPVASMPEARPQEAAMQEARPSAAWAAEAGAPGVNPPVASMPEARPSAAWAAEARPSAAGAPDAKPQETILPYIKPHEARPREAKPPVAREGRKEWWDGSDAPAEPARLSPARPIVSPRARGLAVAQGVDLSKVTPTGPGGRILESDVIAAANAAYAAPYPVGPATYAQARDPVMVGPVAQAPAIEIPAVQAQAPAPAPAIEIPPTQAPVIESPPAQAPAIDIPRAQAPAIDIPPAQAPAIDIPPAQAPAIDIPRAQAPAIESPPAQAPAIDIPRAHAPAEPQAESPQARAAARAQAQAHPPLAGMDDAAYEDVAFTNIRAVIGKAMMASLHRSAQLTHHHSFDATNVLALREDFKASDEAHGYRGVSVGDIILYVTSRALAKHPEINALVAETGIRKCHAVNLGVAVDTPRGLMVPTVFGAEKKSLREISAEVRSLAAAAREGRLSPDKMKGGTFTVSNLGATGVEMFTPIINPPQAAILGICGVVERMRRGKGGRPEAYPSIGVSITYDHRAIDGAPASRFAAELCKALSEFSWKTLAQELESEDARERK